MAYIRARDEDGALGSFGCGPDCPCANCRQKSRGRQSSAGLSGFAGSILATDPRSGAQCRADEHRFSRIIEPSPSQLVNIQPRYLADPSSPKQLHRAAYDAYLRLKAAAEADGIPPNLLVIVSGFRSIQSQQRLWENALRRYGNPETARRWVAPPGGSPHHTGRAIDFSLGTRNDSANIPALRSTLAYKWLVCNAARFGFTPYRNEPWHWEFNPEGVVPEGTSPLSAPPPTPSPGRRPSLASEAQLIQEAIRRGVRDANRLTDLVFHPRHPERRGQPLRANEQDLVREWTDIRERLVRPALARVSPVGPAPAPPAAGLDPRRELDRVHPELARRINLMAQALARRGIQIRVTSGLRTFAEQDVLYEQGRTRPGNIVTKARAGQSNHNYGLAVDVVPLVNGRPNWNAPGEVWQAIGEEGRGAGLSWGGDWRGFVDLPHFELPVGMSVQECLRIYRQGGLPAVWAEANRRVARQQQLPLPVMR